MAHLNVYSISTPVAGYTFQPPRPFNHFSALTLKLQWVDLKSLLGYLLVRKNNKIHRHQNKVGKKPSRCPVLKQRHGYISEWLYHVDFMLVECCL